MGKECDYLIRHRYNDYYCTKVKKNISYDTYIEYCTEYKHSDCSNYTACYIATLICSTMGDRCVLDDLKYLRYNLLEKDSKYKSLLNEYDILGPIIVDRLRKDKHKEQIIKNLFNLCIKEVSQLVRNQKYEEAINLYKNMVYLLKEGYNIHNVKQRIYIK